MVRPLDVAVGLYGHYESIDEVKHYYGLLAIYGLARTADAAGDDDLWARCEKILRRFPDEIDHPTYNFPSYTIGGISQAYLLATGRMGDRAHLVREYADEMMRAPRDPSGIVIMPREPESNKIWIDAAMATTLYLLYAGLALAERSYVDEAVRQAVLMYDELLDPDAGLLHQCKNVVGPGLYSQDHWGRGNGWGYLALAELVAALPADSPHRAGVVERFRALSAALLAHQSERGLWRQEIPDDHSYEESSGTGLILYGIGLGMRHDALDPARYAEPFRHGVAGLAGICINPDFSTEFSCPGCLAPGEGKDKGTVKAYMTLRLPYLDERHSFGPLILALTEAHRHGITDVRLRNRPHAL
ncbi:glycoside hydrolase family 88 protein [Phytoactinopolyspora endophytica]|uniref:glycoside hydrolase family 88 protein n=1 Tax=Phytoactinopolyspora endophytica TaxID=1642495 RepID=UPI00101CFA86|nr:glycoside hydrolase family 88 protein [Phytoactinopolyspora endophytica]